MGAYQLDQYKQNKILTASPGEVLLSLYDGAIRFANEARVAIEAGDIRGKATKIDRLLAVLSELSATLNPEVSEELCTNLLALYEYLASQSLKAGFTMDAGPLNEVVSHLQELREAWRQASQEVTP